MKVTMTGGSPWGFKMTGGKDFRQTLAIGKVTVGSKAQRAGIVEGHQIICVNSENVTELSHLAAQNKIKACGHTLILELSNTPVKRPASADTNTISAPSVNMSAPTHYKSASVPASTMSTSRAPSSPAPYQPSTTQLKPDNTYKDRNSSTSSQPDVEYHKIDHRESQRRMYDDTADSEWRPSVHTDSKAQSPTFAMLQRSGQAPHQSVLSPPEKTELIVTSELSDLILEEEERKKSKRHDDAHHAGAVKQWNPETTNGGQPRAQPYQPPTQQYNTPTQHYNAPPQSYGPPQGAQNNAGKTTAIGNISKFISNTGAKQGAPVFAKALNDLEATVGDPAVLEVRIGPSLPAPTIQWYHNGKPLRESKERDVRFLSKGAINTLVIGEFTSEFNGNYRCELINKHGSTSCRCNVTAKNVTTTTYTPSYNISKTNSSPAAYQPANKSPTAYKSTYNNDQPRTTVSNPSGLYSANNQQRAYEGQVLKKSSRSSSSSSSSAANDEESAVLRALREQDEVRNQPIQSRSMKMLQEAIQMEESNGLPESDEL